jgi:hypothetical protein
MEKHKGSGFRGQEEYFLVKNRALRPEAVWSM